NGWTSTLFTTTSSLLKTTRTSSETPFWGFLPRSEGATVGSMFLLLMRRHWRDFRTVLPLPMITLAGFHENRDVICLTRLPVNNPNPHAVMMCCERRRCLTNRRVFKTGYRLFALAIPA